MTANFLVMIAVPIVGAALLPIAMVFLDFIEQLGGDE